MTKAVLLGLGAGAAAVWAVKLQQQFNSLKQEIKTMGFTIAQQAQIDAALASNNDKFLQFVKDAVAAETAEIKLEIQKIETKVNEGTVTPADMQLLLAKISNSPNAIQAAVQAAVGAISADSGADASAGSAGSGGTGDPGSGGGTPNPDPDAP